MLKILSKLDKKCRKCDQISLRCLLRYAFHCTDFHATDSDQAMGWKSKEFGLIPGSWRQQFSYKTWWHDNTAHNITVHASEGCLYLFQMNIGVSTQNCMTFLSTTHLLWQRSVWLCIRPMWMPWTIRFDVRLRSTIHLCLDTFPTWRYGNKNTAWAPVASSCDYPQFLLGSVWWSEREKCLI